MNGIFRTLALLIVFACSLLASETQITDTVYNPANGRIANGAVTITPSVPLRMSDGSYVAKQPATVPIIKGQFSISLPPNDTTPGSYYHVLYAFTDGTSYQESWYVPTSATALKIGNIVASQVGPVVGILQEDSAGRISAANVANQSIQVNGASLPATLKLNFVSGTSFTITPSSSTDTTTLTMAATGSVGPGNQVWASPADGSTGPIALRPLVVADIPASLQSDTSGNAGNVTGIVSLLHGGTGATNAIAALSALGGVNASQAAAAAPVQSVNGQTGPVSLIIPTTTSALTNDSGFITATSAPVQSVNGQTGIVTIPGYLLPVGSPTILGGVKQGSNTLIAPTGEISVPAGSFDAAGAAAAITLSGLGGVTSAQAAAAAPVQSFATRTGAITPQTGDYATFYDAIGAATTAQAAAQAYASNASNLSSGTVASSRMSAVNLAGIGNGGVSGLLPYASLSGTPTIPTTTSQLTNNSGFITSAGAPVQSFATRTGAIVPQASDYSSFYEVPLTFSGGLTRTSNAVSLTSPIPTQTSQLTNDSAFATLTQASVAAPITAGVTGTANSVSGFNACHSLTTGSFNTCVGTSALFSDTTGGANMAVGNGALFAMVAGTDNVAVGKGALVGNTGGNNNIAIGSSSNSAATTASFDISIGSFALAADSGGNNVCMGGFCLQANTTGQGNTAIGPGAPGNKNTTGNNNTFLGNSAGNNSTATVNNSTALGTGAQVTLSHQVMLGTSSDTVYIPGSMAFMGTTSGVAKLVAAPVAGSPNPIQLPTATGVPGAFLQTNGANPQVTSWQQIASADLPATIAANTTGTAANITGIAAIPNGGTGQATASAALSALGGTTLAAATAAAPVQSVNGLTGAVTTEVPLTFSGGLVRSINNVTLGAIGTGDVSIAAGGGAATVNTVGGQTATAVAAVSASYAAKNTAGNLVTTDGSSNLTIAGTMQSPVFKGAAATSDIILNDGAGNQSLRGTRQATWADTASTSWLQLGNTSTDDVFVSGKSGSVLTRLGILTSGMVLGSGSPGSFPVPSTIFTILNSTTPAYAFDISASGATSNFRTTSTTAYEGVNLTDSSGVLVGSFGYGGTTAPLFTNQLFFGPRNASTDLVFTAGGNTTERMRLTHGGLLGIGTTNPQNPLDVQGAYGQAIFGSTGSAGYIAFRRSSDGSPQGGIGYSSAAESAIFKIQSAGGSGAITFNTATGERARIDSSGHFAIGSTAGTNTLSIAGNEAVLAAVAPTGITVVPVGTAGTTTYSYQVVAHPADGTSAVTGAVAAVSTTTGNATLSATNYNTVTWTPSAGDVTYDVYRTASGGSPSTTGKIISSTNQVSFNDTGVAGDSTTTPTVNTTGRLGVGTATPATLLSVGSTSQFQVDGSGNLSTLGLVNFSGASASSPFKVGLAASLPATCTAGQTYYETDAPAGSNLYGCTATNTWTLQAPVQSVAGRTGDVTLSNTDISGLGTASVHPATDFDLAGAASTAQTAAQAFAANASNLSSGTVASGRIAAINLAGTGNGGVTGLLPYASLSGTPTIPTTTSQLTNNSGYITSASAPVQSVNSLTGAVSITLDSISPFTTLGDVLYRSSTGGARLAGNTTAAKNFLCQTGTGTVSAAPAWCLLASSDLPAINLAGTGNGGVSGLLPYASLSGAPTIPTNTNQLTNGAGFITASGAPVQSVNGSTGAVTVAPMVYPGAGIPVSTGTVWSASLTAPASALVGISDTQTLTNKSIASSEITGLPAFPTGAIVGTTDAQTLTNKSIAASEINSGTLGLTNGGTGQATAAAAFNALSPMTTLGDMEYESATGVASRLAGNTAATKKLFCQTGTGTVSAAPAWCTLTGTDIPAINLAGTGAGGVTGLLPYASLSGTPTIPTTTSQLTNNSGFLTAAVTSVALTPPALMSIAGSPITSSGTLALSWTTGQTANQFLASPNGATGAVGLRSMVSADIPPINLASTANGGVTGSLPYASLSGAPTIPTAGTGLTNTSGAFSVNYGTTSTTAAAGNDTRIANAIQDPGANGLTARTAANTVAARTLQSSAGGALAWTNGNGVSGNPTPTFVLPSKEYYRAAICQGTTAYAGFSLPASGPTPNCSSGTNTNFGLLAFTTGQTAQDHFKLPADWTGAIDVEFEYLSSGTTGNVVWNAATACVADGATTDPTFNTAQTVSTAAQATTLQQKTASLSSLTTTGCSANSEFHFKIGLDASTTTIGVSLIGLRVTVRRAL